MFRNTSLIGLAVAGATLAAASVVPSAQASADDARLTVTPAVLQVDESTPTARIEQVRYGYRGGWGRGWGYRRYGWRGGYGYRGYYRPYYRPYFGANYGGYPAYGYPGYGYGYPAYGYGYGGGYW